MTNKLLTGLGIVGLVLYFQRKKAEAIPTPVITPISSVSIPIPIPSPTLGPTIPKPEEENIIEMPILPSLTTLVESPISNVVYISQLPSNPVTIQEIPTLTLPGVPVTSEQLAPVISPPIVPTPTPIPQLPPILTATTLELVPTPSVPKLSAKLEDELVLKLITDKDEYFADDLISITFLVLNSKEYQIDLKFPYLSNYDFVLFKDNKEIWSTDFKRQSILTSINFSYGYLSPKEIWKYQRINISLSFDVFRYFGKPFEPGTYTLKATFYGTKKENNLTLTELSAYKNIEIKLPKTFTLKEISPGRFSV